MLLVFPSKHVFGDSPRRAPFTCVDPEHLFPNTAGLIQMLVFVMRWQVGFPSDDSSNGPVCAAMLHIKTVIPESAKPSRCSFVPQSTFLVFLSGVLFDVEVVLPFRYSFDFCIFLNCHFSDISHSGNVKLKEGLVSFFYNGLQF